MVSAMNFCNQCGAPLVLRVPAGDSMPRHVCSACGRIHYENPKLVVGCIAEWQERILLCRRAIEPRHGLWTLPAGFMENHESCWQAAERETLEEAGARVSPGELFALIDVPHISQVHLFFRARLLDGAHNSGVESLETALFEEASVPWEALAFRSVGFALRAFFADRNNGVYGLHTTVLMPQPA